MMNFLSHFEVGMSELEIGYDVSLLPFESVGFFGDWRLPNQKDLDFIRDYFIDDYVISLPRALIVKAKQDTFAGRNISNAINNIHSTQIEPLQVNVRLHLMAWAIRREGWTKSTIPLLVDMAVVNHCRSVVLDAEEGVTKGWCVMDPVAFATLVRQEFDRARGLWQFQDDVGLTAVARDLQLIVTGLGGLPNVLVPLLDVCDAGCPQAYSWYMPHGRKNPKTGMKWEGKHWSNSRLTFPGPQQDIAWEKWAPHFDKPEQNVIMGLSCYDGARPQDGRVTPALTEIHTMRFSAIQAAALGCKRVWYWSVKHGRSGIPKGQLRRKFFGRR
jgi:hypothetical protein